MCLFIKVLLAVIACASVVIQLIITETLFILTSWFIYCRGIFYNPDIPLNVTVEINIMRFKSLPSLDSKCKVELSIFVFVHISHIFLIIHSLLMVCVFKVDHYLPLCECVDKGHANQHKWEEGANVGLYRFLSVNIESNATSKHIERLEVVAKTALLFRHTWLAFVIQTNFEI